MKKEIFVVIAYKNGNRESHSYTVGAFNKKAQAIKCAESHADYRGGKYSCTVEVVLLNTFCNDADDYSHEIYRAI